MDEHEPPRDVPILAAKANVEKVMATVMSAQKGKIGVLLGSMMSEHKLGSGLQGVCIPEEMVFMPKPGE